MQANWRRCSWAYHHYRVGEFSLDSCDCGWHWCCGNVDEPSIRIENHLCQENMYPHVSWLLRYRRRLISSGTMLSSHMMSSVCRNGKTVLQMVDWSVQSTRCLYSLTEDHPRNQLQVLQLVSIVSGSSICATVAQQCSFLTQLGTADNMHTSTYSG